MAGTVRTDASLLLLSLFLLPYLLNGKTALAAMISATRSWCVSKPGMTTEKLVENINYACGSGLADCKAIQEDGPCYSTDVIKMASYAMNAYYYGAGHREINCYFDGSALIVHHDPSYDDCIYP
ncbi:glucan endo-1,3-beta-D-glucosidase-like [Zingiber officinale]|uniref:glucan endo-1,3-beta-D-glucosidase-like n=1 Tax=Zingiber officinale TaxID=94328 RepID=UPI001C4CF2A8|nr:glucan endo-1,3-beta-D-glucosidase-like [Zingiber officinale]